MKESVGFTLVIVTALSSYCLEATTLQLQLVQNVGMLNHSTGWVKVHPQDPITVACTSPCGQVEWKVIPESAISNITIFSRTDQRCNSVTGVCVNDFSEPCPGADNDYMEFKLGLSTTTTIIIQCNAYVIFSSDLTTRHMMRGDSFLVIVEEEEEDQVSPTLQAVTPSATITVNNECIQSSSTVIAALGNSHTLPHSTSAAGLTFTSQPVLMSSTILPAPTTMTPTVGSGLEASAEVIIGNVAGMNTSGIVPVTLCSFNSYLIVTVVLGGLLLLTLMALIITCICCKCSSSRTIKTADNLANAPSDPISLSHTTHSSSTRHQSRLPPTNRDFDILEYTDSSELPTSTVV